MSSNVPQKVPQSGIPKAAGSSAANLASTGTSSAKTQTIQHSTVHQTSKRDAQSVAPTVKNQAREASQAWEELEAKYKQDIEALTESTEMATIEKEIAEEKLDNCERELQELKDRLAEATLQIDLLKSEKQASQTIDATGSGSAVTVYQLQKIEEQNEVLKQALIKLRDISAKDKRALEELQIEYEELQEKSLELEVKEQKYLEQIKIYEEQIDVSQNAQEMVEKLTQQKTELEDKMKEMADDIDCMEKLRDLNEQLLESARENEIALTAELDRVRVQYSELNNKRRDMEDYLSDQERTVAKLREENRQLNDQISNLRDLFKEGESIEQQKHQIENVAYKLNFSESKMAEKEAEITRYKRNLSEMEEQMNNLSMITKEQSVRLDELKSQLDTKMGENAELQRALKKKMEEVSELEIRREMAEKKLHAIQRDAELKIANLNRAVETMKGIEIQREEDIKRLMEDNELIERERRELRDQLNKSAKSLERSMQAGNLSMSMMTAQDNSLASLGISFQVSPTNLTPSYHYQQASALQQNVSLGAQQIQPPHSQILGSATGPSKHISLSPEVDESILISRIKDLSAAFDRVNRKNYELELELALRSLNNRAPPYNGASVASCYDVDRARVLRAEVEKLRREWRAAIINQRIPTKSRNIFSQIRHDTFNNSKLVLKCQMLEDEASALMSGSSLSLARPKVPMMQSTPVK